jgi:hypothetical protein
VKEKQRGELGFQKARRDTVVAVELHVIKGCGDAIPSGHGSGLGAAHMRHGGYDDVAEAERFADKDYFEFDRSADWQLPGAKEINAGGADVTSDESSGRFFGHSASSAKAQRKVQGRARIFPMLGMDAHGVCWHSDETARLRWTQERRYAKSRDVRQTRQRQGARHCLARFRGGFGRPGFEWSHALRRAHIALGDNTSLSLAMAQQTKLSN